MHCASQSKSDIVLRQHDALRTSHCFWFVLHQPKQLGCSESRKQTIASQSPNFCGCDFAFCFLADFGRALIIPHNCRSNWTIVRINNHESMHLTCESHGDDVARKNCVVRGQIAQRFTGGAPPNVRVRFGPTWAWRIEFIFNTCSCNDGAITTDSERLQRTCSNINSNAKFRSFHGAHRGRTHPTAVVDAYGSG